MHLLNRQVLKNANQGCHDLGDLSELELFSIIKDALGEVTVANLELGEGVGLREMALEWHAP